MSIDYHLANILGTVYSQGDLVFSPDGMSILSPVGNRVSYFDLANNKSHTFAYEHRRNVMRVAMNRSGTLLLSIDTDGRGILVNLRRGVVLHHINFHDKVGAAVFSPDGAHIAIAIGRKLQIWKTPSLDDEKQFAPFILHRTYLGHFAGITHVEWSKDGRFILTSSKDMTARIFSLHSEDDTATCVLTGHRDRVMGAYFDTDQETIYTVSKDGALFEWQYSDEDDKWIITTRQFFLQEAKVTCSAYHSSRNLLVVGFSSGTFSLYALPDCSVLQTLSISQSHVDHVAINETGDWLLFGVTMLGQLLVWEWQSESYILKQQSHYDTLNTMAYSPDGLKLITGADDGKIKVWDVTSGFCVVTFSQHTAAVTALKFSQNRNVLFSASLDGSIRAWDLMRYRNFRTFVAPSRVQFTSLAVDPSGELVCAGSNSEFEIYVWNVQTAQFVDRLAGHEGPISSLDFSPDGTVLASGSWDGTACLWNFYGRDTQSEVLQLRTEVLSVAFRPDSKELAVTTTDGQISFFNIQEGKQTGAIDGKNDIRGGRHQSDRFTAAHSNRSNHFTSLCYSIDGSMILTGGNSRHICLYDVANEVLLRRFSLSKNMSIEGTLDYLNSKNLTEAGPLDMIDVQEEDSDIGDRSKEYLPGATRGDLSVRRIRPSIHCSAVAFSPVAASFSVASTEGLFVYAVDWQAQFDPYDLNIDVTVEQSLKALQNCDYLTSLVLAFRIGDQNLFRTVFYSIPPETICLVAKGIPQMYLGKMLTFLGNQGQDDNHIGYNLLWLRQLLDCHGAYLASHRQALLVPLRAAQKFLLAVKPILNTAQQNTYRSAVLNKS